MRRVAWLLAVSVSLCNVVSAQQVTLTRGAESVKASIGDDVFTVLQFSPNRRKPYFLPVTAAGGFDLLKSAQPGEPGTAGRQVIVCTENADLKVFEKKTAEAQLNEVLEVGEINGDWLWIPAKDGWLHRSDVAPLASTVTRIVDDNPPKVKDRKSLLYYDHPHHKGIWLAVDEVADIKFWNEDGQIAQQSVELVKPEGNPAILKRTSHWLGQDGAPLMVEEATFSLFANRLMTIDFTLTAAGAPVHIGDTKEGMFAIRLPNSMRELGEGGPVRNAEGVEGTKAAWGKTSRWIDYCGPIDGHEFGVTLMDHPENPWPSRYHVRDYGLFAINPFGAGAYTQGADTPEPAHERQLGDEPLRFRYGLYVHAGVPETEAIETIYQQFVKNAHE